ncbi:hypothetical protein AVEN_86637-1 [Araneus ventricosus]|uniref:Uncharacterized protein n=1 Tax=Araneus ventricosus TaxID=182803 RepID=A0A4Y2WK37_ARAVE|nr:hypothetical protein AVEN_86637-1 [Araneus ventricosus]
MWAFRAVLGTTRTGFSLKPRTYGRSEDVLKGQQVRLLRHRTVPHSAGQPVQLCLGTTDRLSQNRTVPFKTGHEGVQAVLRDNAAAMEYRSRTCPIQNG